MLSTNDIRNQLGITKTTVERWIRKGELKAFKNSNRCGWMINENDYEEFLTEHPKWKTVRDGDVFTQNDLKARDLLITTLYDKISEIDKLVKAEMRGERYMKGYERAMKEMQIILNRELIRKSPSEQRRINNEKNGLSSVT